VETSTAEKNLGDADRDLMLDQVMKSGVPNSVDDRFFSEDVIQEDEDDTVTPTKVKREQEDSPENSRREEKGCQDCQTSWRTSCCVLLSG
jgi:hypothetical protein